MRINDTTKAFFQLHSSEMELTFDTLEEMYYKSTELFEDYFKNHCTKTKENIETAITCYDIQDLTLRAQALPRIIHEVSYSSIQHFGFEADINFNLFIGAYGSNAYAYGNSVYLALEKLPSETEYLKLIIAHEIAHVYHYFILQQVKTDWDRIPLMHGVTGMYFEGVATFISKRLVPDLPEHEYYSYDNTGEDWLKFCLSNKRDIAKAFLGVNEWKMEEMREWFRLSGGRTFGLTRLGYFLGTAFIEDTVRNTSETQAYTLLADNNFITIARNWLQSISESKQI